MNVCWVYLVFSLCAWLWDHRMVRAWLLRACILEGTLPVPGPSALRAHRSQQQLRVHGLFQVPLFLPSVWPAEGPITCGHLPVHNPSCELFKSGSSSLVSTDVCSGTLRCLEHAGLRERINASMTTKTTTKSHETPRFKAWRPGGKQ